MSTGIPAALEGTGKALLPVLVGAVCSGCLSLCINNLSQMVQLMTLYRYWHWVTLISDLHPGCGWSCPGQKWPSGSGSVPLPTPIPSLLGWLGFSRNHSSIRRPWQPVLPEIRLLPSNHALQLGWSWALSRAPCRVQGRD